MSTYPQHAKLENSDNPAIHIYGNRIHADQTLYEYINEFLLIFVSAKDEHGNGKMAFHEKEPIAYYVEPRNGLRRFIFYDNGKKNFKIKEDEEAYRDIIDILKRNIDARNNAEKNSFIYAIQDLFYGYATVLGKRTWCAQSLLPLCPEMIFCEEMPNDKERLKGYDNWCRNNPVHADYDKVNTFIDASFDLSRHNFMARGGELYYLHIMQILEKNQENKEKLETLLKLLLTKNSSSFSKLANWIQSKWEENRNIDPAHLVKKMTMGYIPDDSYWHAGTKSVDELINFLNNQLHPIQKIELLAKGIVFQILRMQNDQTASFLGKKVPYPIIIDMKGNKSSREIRQISAESFNTLSDAFYEAINLDLDIKSESLDDEEKYSLTIKARKESLDVFRKKGKELQFIIPANGPYERFSLSEDLVTFLVLSIIPSGEKMDLNLFLNKLYEHFSLVIGPEEYRKAINNNEDLFNKEYFNNLINSFEENKDAFQSFLKSTGFLRDLSDATSIVVNPYKGEL